jgi:hypothetical protein
LSKEKVSLEPIHLQETEIEWQDLVTKNLGDLIAAAPTLSPLPQRKIHETLSTYVNIIASGNIAAFAKNIGKSQFQTRGWCLGKTLPTISTLLDICFQLKIL